MISESIKEPTLLNYRSELSKVRDLSGLCPFCGGTAVVQGPVEYPDLNNSYCCLHCEAGRELAVRLARIVSDTLESNRT